LKDSITQLPSQTNCAVSVQTHSEAALHTADFALWRLPTVLAHYPVSKSAWWAGVKDGIFPSPVRLSVRSVAWRAGDIRTLIASL